MSSSQSFRKNFHRWLLNHPRFNPYWYFTPGFSRVISAPFRTLPNFLIIGTQKSGSSSLYDYMIQHSEIHSAIMKETDYFLGRMPFYRSNFPSKISKFLSKTKNQNFVTGEASVRYFYHPEVISKIQKIIPSTKLISIFRNPIDRSFSQFNRLVNVGRENRTFDEAVKQEIEQIQKNKNQKNFFSKTSDFSYLTRGIYVEHLKKWTSHFPKSQFLILDTNDLNNNPQEVLNKIFDFVNVSREQIQIKHRRRVGSYKKMNPNTRNLLLDFFRTYNEELNDSFNIDFNWDE